MIQNPILPGFYPDPSICRVGDDFYLVTSSFSFFPGLPVFHSRDLVHWEQLGHVINRPGQLCLDGRRLSGGLWAPTIRWHNNLFYVICTHSDVGGDFVCTAEDPAGPWSDPHWIPDAPGIDPSLFWDGDGSCWMTGNDWSTGECYIWGCRLDDRTFRLMGKPRELWRGALKDAHAPEAPHLYYKDGWYYLLIAEGGTGFFHAVTAARARSISGPYTGYPGNPILTHRHLGHGAGITCTGHADLVELADGSWYMTCLACRPINGSHLILGRETFLAPVAWEEGWPVVHPGVGRLTLEVPAPELPPHPFPQPDPNNWNSPVWNQLGCGAACPVTVQGSDLKIRCVSEPVVPAGSPEVSRSAPVYDAGDVPAPIGFFGRRQQHSRFSCRVSAVLPARPRASCGLIVLQNHFHALRLELYRSASDAVRIRFVKSWLDREQGLYTEQTLACQNTSSEPDTPFRTELSLGFADGCYTFSWNHAAPVTADGSFLGSETAGGFIGAYVGLFASGNGLDLPDVAVFRDFRYIPLS